MNVAAARSLVSTGCTNCPTRGVCLASELAPDQLTLLNRVLAVSPVIQAGEHLYRAGDRSRGQFHVRSGTFKTYVIDREGDEYVTDFLLPGEVGGTAQEEGRYVDSAVALEASTVCILAEDRLDDLFLLGLGTGLVRRGAESAARAMRRRVNLLQSSAQARVAGCLIDFSDRLKRLGRCPSFIPTPMSRTDVACYLGMTLETLSRVLSRLSRAGVIDASRKHIEILEPETIAAAGGHALP